jgi:hypothetical protein
MKSNEITEAETFYHFDKAKLNVLLLSMMEKIEISRRNWQTGCYEKVVVSAFSPMYAGYCYKVVMKYATFTQETYYKIVAGMESPFCTEVKNIPYKR